MSKCIEERCLCLNICPYLHVISPYLHRTCSRICMFAWKSVSAYVIMWEACLLIYICRGEACPCTFLNKKTCACVLLWKAFPCILIDMRSLCLRIRRSISLHILNMRSLCICILSSCEKLSSAYFLMLESLCLRIVFVWEVVPTYS